MIAQVEEQGSECIGMAKVIRASHAANEAEPLGLQFAGGRVCPPVRKFKHASREIHKDCEKVLWPSQKLL